MHARSVGYTSREQVLSRFLCTVAAVVAAGVVGCASPNVVRAPITAALPCPSAQFLYTDWTEKGRGIVAVYRCEKSVAARDKGAEPKAGQGERVITRRP